MIQWLKNLLNTARHPEHRLGLLRQYPSRSWTHEVPVSRSSVPSEMPRICLVTPSYQQGDYIEETFKSVLDQTYPNLAYGVQDGGSTDQTIGIMQRYKSRLDFIDSAPDQGQTDAIMLGFNRLQPQPEDIMAWLNSDDLLLPGTLDLVGHTFLTHPDVDVIYGHRIILDKDGGEIGRWILPEYDPEVLRWIDFIPQETLFFRSSAYKKVGELDPSFEFAMDWDLLLRFQEAGCRFMRVNYFMGCFRVHDRQKTSAYIDTVGAREMHMLRYRHLKNRFNLKDLDRIFSREIYRSYSASKKLSQFNDRKLQPF